MKLRVLGCAPAWGNPGGAQSGYLLEDGSRRLLLDCGPGVLPALRVLSGGRWPHVDAIVLSHWHHDHWGDLVAWVWGLHSGPGKGTEPPELWCPPPGRSRLSDFGEQLAWGSMFDDVFRIHDYEEGVRFEAAGLEINSAFVPHWTSPSYALRVTNGERTLAYSGDSGPSDALIELARDADLFLCEATLADGAPDWDPRTHMSGQEAVATFEAAGAKRLLLTHRPYELPAPDGFEVARDGLEVEI